MVNLKHVYCLLVELVWTTNLPLCTEELCTTELNVSNSLLGHTANIIKICSPY